MKKLSSNGIKLLKVFHLIFAMIWTCGAISMILITFLIIPESGDEHYMKYSILLMIDNFLIIPGAIISLLIGIIYGVYTNWGFFKYNWLTLKWIITVAQIMFGTFAYHPRLIENLNMLDQLREVYIENSVFIANLSFMQISGFFQAGLLVLMIIVSVFKPWKKKIARVSHATLHIDNQ